LVWGSQTATPISSVTNFLLAFGPTGTANLWIYSADNNVCVTLTNLVDGMKATIMVDALTSSVPASLTLSIQSSFGLYTNIGALNWVTTNGNLSMYSLLVCSNSADKRVFITDSRIYVGSGGTCTLTAPTLGEQPLYSGNMVATNQSSCTPSGWNFYCNHQGGTTNGTYTIISTNQISNTYSEYGSMYDYGYKVQAIINGQLTPLSNAAQAND
jgi:hypothetical protein